MIKKVCLGLYLLMFSCTSTNNINQPSNTDNKAIDSNVDIKKELISFFSLKKEIESNENIYFKGAYFDDDNSGIIFLNNEYYIIKGSEYKKYGLPDRLKGKNFYSISLNKTGNGLGFSLPDTTTGMGFDSEIIKFKDFTISEVKNIDKNSYPYVINIYDNYSGKGYGLSYQNSFDIFDIQGFFNYKIISSHKFSESEKISGIILNSKLEGFIFTREEYESKYKNKLYSVKNNSLILINIDYLTELKNIFSFYQLKGKIDDNGNGFIHYGDKINIINNYNILPEVKTVDDSLLSFMDMNKKGDGFIIEYEKFDSNPYSNLNKLFFYNLLDFKSENNKTPLVDFGVAPNSTKYCINNHGNGFLLISGDKSHTNGEFKYINKLYIVRNYKIIDKLQ